jgi:hypothetical protein
VLLAIAAVPLGLGAAQSGLLTASGRLPPVPIATGVAEDGKIDWEGSLLLTESPVSNEFIARSEQRTRSRSQRSGLTSSGQPAVYSPYANELGDGDSVFPLIPDQPTVMLPQLGSGSFRTLCVRLCDGYYWPVSFSTTRAGLAEDEATCEQSCGSPVKLFFYRNPNGTTEEAVDLAGQRYASLDNAFRYRSEYVASCKCQPDPWEAASLARHQKYAELAKEGRLALWDERKPKTKRPARLVTITDVSSALEPGAANVRATTFSSIGSDSPADAVTVTRMRTSRSKAPLGIATIGQSASGVDYSVKR